MNSPGNITGDRERVLASIRHATIHASTESPEHAVSSPDRENYAKLLPRVPEDWESKLKIFTARCEGLRAVLKVVDDDAAMAAVVQDIVNNDGGRRVAYHRTPIVTPLIESLGTATLCVDGGYDPLELEQCDIGITGCFALVAQTGSVMVTSESTGGRALSVLPPHHIVLASAEDLVTDLPTAYAKFAAHAERQPSSMLSLISGPSRTGDIERILVLGAHGPKRLTIVLRR